jgi:Ca-activated chloride channel family protein
MHRYLSLSILSSLLVIFVFADVRRGDSQATAAADQGNITYRLRISVDEVDLTFHAVDEHGLPVNDLKLDELSLRDNGRSPSSILAFQSMRDIPIRAGILMDTSESMRDFIAANRAISIEYAQRLLRQRVDQAFVMDFGHTSKIAQPWTSDPTVLIAGVRSASGGRENLLGGTAMFDAIFWACYSEFGRTDYAATGNFILLFSDGEDNASHTSLNEVVTACQRTHTAIYPFRADPKSSFFSGGGATLAELASKTGGRVFHDNGSEAEIYDDLRTIEADLRNEYRLVYKPAALKHDGTFHRIELKAPERVESLVIRSGYYAPSR